VEWVACRTWCELSSCRSRPSRSARPRRPVARRRSANFSVAKAWSRVRLGRRESGGASGRCAGVGTPSGSGRSALHAPWPSRARHDSHVWVRLGLFDALHSVGSSAASVLCRLCHPDCARCSRGRPWVAAGQPWALRWVATSTGSRIGSSTDRTSVPLLLTTQVIAVSPGPVMLL
jgi:hypothetical protein